MKIIVLVILCIFNLSMYIKYLYNNLIRNVNSKKYLKEFLRYLININFLLKIN